MFPEIPSKTLPQYKPENASESTTTAILLTPPSEEDPTSQILPDNNQPTHDNNAILDLFKSTFLPAAHTATTSLLDLMHRRPVLSTFLLAQFLCACIPIGLFVLGAIVSVAVALIIFSCVAVMVLGPVLVG
ncbi:hypothetical protein BBP40_006415, partial [Aspergillus hancockii]